MDVAKLPELTDLEGEIERRLASSLCSGCERARKSLDLWCYPCLLLARALRIRKEPDSWT